ncbi:MAG: hypothetical protein Q8L39_09030 [Burkholderiales bacterium]|nr:hypothetical protein [Burkholderiales bacterium]
MFNEETRLRAVWRAVALAGSGLLLACSASAVQAQSRGGQSIELAGVHLGMSREDSIKTLMANDPPLVDDGIGGNSSAIQFRVPALSPDPFVWSMKFRAKPAEDARDKPLEQVELYFALPPNESTVLSLRRNSCFDCGDGKAKAYAPTAANFLDSIAKRFGSPNASVIQSRNMHGNVVIGEVRFYAWTRTGELLTEQEFQKRMKYPAQCTGMLNPDNARNSNSINFRAFEQSLGQKGVIDNCATIASVQWSQDGKNVLRHYYITVTDYAGMLSAFSKSAEVVEGKANQQRKQELDRANKNPTKL